MRSGSDMERIAAHFAQNMNRVYAMGTLPIKMVALATINEAARIVALVNLGLPIIGSSQTISDETKQKLIAERQRLVAQWSEDWLDSDAYGSAIGVAGFNTLLANKKDEYRDSIQATLAGMLIGLWTAFESQAQDAWVLAVNAHRKPLADRVLNPLSKDEQQKLFSGKTLSDADYNLQNCMGDVLLRTRKVDFQTLANIVKYYSVAFDKKFDAIFDAHHDKLFELETMRNCFAHKGGIADEKFISRMSKSPVVKDAWKGKVVVVHGSYVADMAKTVSSCVTKLLTALDEWMANPT